MNKSIISFPDMLEIAAKNIRTLNGLIESTPEEFDITCLRDYSEEEYLAAIIRDWKEGKNETPLVIDQVAEESIEAGKVAEEIIAEEDSLTRT